MDNGRNTFKTQNRGNAFSNLNQKNVRLAILFGFAGLVGILLPYTLKIHGFSITFQWSLIFPLVIALVYGWQYAIISIVLGGIWLFPFISLPGDGWANLYNMVQYCGWIIWHGYFADQNRVKASWKTNVFTIQVLYLLLYILPQIYLYPVFFHFNPPFWFPRALTTIASDTVYAIALKSVFLQFFYVNIGDTLLLLPFVKRILNIPVKKSCVYNCRIILISIIMGFLICQFLTLLNLLFVRNIYDHIIRNMFTSQLSFENIVIFLSCILIGNICAKFVETRLELEQEYRESEKRFRIVFDNALIGIALDDLKNQFTTNNPMIIHHLGFTEEEYNAMTFRDFTHPDDLQQDLNFNEQLRNGKLDNYQIEKRFIHKNGYITWGKLTVSTVKGIDNKPEYILTMVEDITEAKLAAQKIANLNTELENRVLERTSELELSNKELESFAYTISHDLRTPLRNINGWSNILISDYALSLNHTAKGILNHLCTESIRMAELIDALLEISRVARVHLKYEHVSLSQIAESILGNLIIHEPERKIEYSIAKDLQVEGDPALLHNVLSNLMDNAWKFTSQEEVSQIEFGSLMDHHHPVYFIRDNGVGFDMRYVDKLFKSFQRLHQLNEFAGSGIGLASVAKIIQRHKGKIWIESEENIGTTIFFTLNEHTVSKAIETVS